MDGLLATPDSEFLTARLMEMLTSGRTGAARPMLAALRRLTPPSPRLAELGALLALSEGRLGDALAELDVAIAEHPDHAGLRRCRADIRHRAGDISGASHDAAEAVILEPANAPGKAILGVLMMELGRPADAARCLSEARASLPANAAICEALAQAQAAAGDVEGAAATLAAGVVASPGAMSLRNASVLLAVRRREFAVALALAEEARRNGLVDACLFGLKGHALTSLGRHEEAADAYREALKLGPEDPYVRHLVAASGGVAETDRAPADYLCAVFD
ncbi:MAG: tetratricopeptide repeat protein, partial [Acetobacteraceae bacterium]